MHKKTDRTNLYSQYLKLIVTDGMNDWKESASISKSPRIYIRGDDMPFQVFGSRSVT